ncbi:MAG: hypothetical protein J0H47_05755 [Gammaproteobacteria bacterium]|nr:hypothetical protein [Gammaproteobacteria bacterium]
MLFIFIGYALLAVLATSRVDSSTAAIGYIFIPFTAFVIAIKAGFYGLALSYAFYVVKQKYPKINFFFIVSFFILLYGCWWIVVQTIQTIQVKVIIENVQTTHSAEELAKIFNDSQKMLDNNRQYILEAIALNPATSTQTLRDIANLDIASLHQRTYSLFFYQPDNRKGFAVMRLVAMHPHTDEATLKILSGSPSSYVIAEVAQNPNADPSLLRRLWQQYGNKIALTISRNPHTPPDILVTLANEPDLEPKGNELIQEWLKANIAKNPNTPPEILEKLSHEQSWLILQFLIDNEKIPQPLLEALTHHRNETVSTYAKDKLRRLQSKN